MATAEELAYAESVRAIEQQSRNLDEVRSRTGVLLAGASIVASFLGSEALQRSGLVSLAGLGLLAFCGVIALCIAILVPREWQWAVPATEFLRDWADGPNRNDSAAMQRFLATRIEEFLDANRAQLGTLLARFRWAAFALGVEALAWTLDLA